MSAWRWLGRRRAEDELRREIDAHVAERTDDLMAEGLSEADAQAQARREFGNRTLPVERSREAWIAPWRSSVAQDLRYAIRSCTRQPGFTLSALAVLALGIGPVTALFTYCNGVLLRPWPVPDPSSIAIVKPIPGPAEEYGSLSSLEYRYLRDHSRAFTQLATWMLGGGPITYRDTRVDFLQTNFVSANYFGMLGVRMQMGRGFLPEDEDYASPRAVAIISERLWREYFGSPASILGETILVYDRPFTVVGVAQRGFFDVQEFRRDVWMPRPSVALLFPRSSAADLRRFADPKPGGVEQVAGRLAPDVTPAAARAELDLLGAQFRRDVGIAAHGYTLSDTRPLTQRPAGQGNASAWLTIGGALLMVTLLACANAGNLFLARGLSRQREIAIRVSIGASRGRIVRQLLTEALLLSALAGAAGLALGIATLRVTVVSARPMLGNPELFVPDLRVTAFAMAIALFACVAAALMPAFRSSRVSLASRAGESAAGRAGAGRLRTALLATQLALSMVLLLGAGLLTRAVSRATTVDPGYPIHGVQALSIRLPEGTTAARAASLHRALRLTLESGGFPPVAASEFTAISTAYRSVSFRPSSARARSVLARDVSSRYFSVLGIPLTQGRSLSDDERVDEVVVSESASRMFWPGGGAVGSHLTTGEDRPHAYTVVGVVPDVAVISLSQTQPVVYQPLRSPGLLFVRDFTPGIADRIAVAVRGIEPKATVMGRPLADDLAAATRDAANASAFAWTLGAVALILTTIGAFGVFAYTVEERRREIGVRMALGARPLDVVLSVVGGMRGALIAGLGGGLLLSSIVAPVMRRFLFGLSPFDPIAYAGVMGILVTAALVATWVPARRAARIDPAVTLRAD
jgi:predicted permease